MKKNETKKSYIIIKVASDIDPECSCLSILGIDEKACMKFTNEVEKMSKNHKKAEKNSMYDYLQRIAKNIAKVNDIRFTSKPNVEFTVLDKLPLPEEKNTVN